MSNPSPLARLEERLGVSFRKKDLLLRAVTHRSYINEHPDPRTLTLGHYETLEFLGDSVLELTITEYLVRNFPGESEGDLTKFRSEVVSTKTLIEVAEKLGIELFVRCSRGERLELDKNAARKRMYADVVEAIIGAIYLDRGFMTAQMFIFDTLLPKVGQIQQEGFTDWSSQLQEEVQAREGITPRYRVLSERGPDHERTYTVGVFVGDRLLAEGTGKSKKCASFRAAHAGIQLYNKDISRPR